MWEQLKKYREIARLALLQEKASKNSKIKGMNEHEKEFLPAVLEVTEMPPSHAARLLTYVIVAMFTVLILWSVIGKIDIIATAAGKLMPASNIKTIQTLTDSEIEEIYVQEGEYVKAGQDLIKFNQTEVIANISRIENEIEALKIAIARLQALLTENPQENFNYDRDIDAYLIKMHADLLKSQIIEKSARIDVLKGQIAKAEKEKDTISADLGRIEKLLPSVTERIEKKKILVDKKLLARLTFLEQQEELTNLQEQRNVQAKKMAETEENIEYLKKELRQYLAEFDKNLMQELTENREKLASYQQELVKYREALKRTVVKAPLSGYVQQLVYHTKGGVVETAKPIMNIVPENYKLEAQVMILNKDIGFVRPEQDVEIKIDSFPFTKYGTLKGKVRNISGDAVQDEKLGLVFNARLTLSDNKIKADGQIIRLKPGMSVTAEIKTGKRRVIEYLLSPVMKYLNESMRER
ncbi:MAG: HlyD family type I secretion periplasmic adaptor subunit [Alphaproteobacteria bacterium]|nr:HlyD family type I secretion periplasmic adaptor subunit [Alphaproteobacteria bacterium]